MAFIDELTKDSLEKCIKNGEFEMYLQPQYSISKNCIIGAEALVRWRHLDSFIPPSGCSLKGRRKPCS